MSEFKMPEPQEGQLVRFVDRFSISQDVATHGIPGIFKDGRFWSHDMADHWAPHEVTFWAIRSIQVGGEHAG